MTELILGKNQVLFESAGRPNLCALSAKNDQEAVNAWLFCFNQSPNTFKSYQKEAKKLLVFAKYEAKKPLIEFKKEDFERYIAFLSYPPKAWVGSTQNSQALFLVQNQSMKAVRYNIRVINALLNYLVEADYLYKNPLKLIKQLSKLRFEEERALSVQAKVLEDDEFQAVLETLDNLPQASYKDYQQKIKTKVIFAMLYHLGLRVSELSCAMWDNFKMVQGKCWYFVEGKGRKLAEIPVNDELLTLIQNYRQHLGLAMEVSCFESDWVIKSMTGNNLSARRIREMVKEVFVKTAERFSDASIQVKLKNASPHDLRHLLASDLDKHGVSIIDTKAILRHDSERTTEIYRHSKTAKRHAMSQKTKVGMQLSATSRQPTITLEIECKPGDVVGFSYFLKTVQGIFLKPYVEQTKAFDAVLQDFKRQAITHRMLHLHYTLRKAPVCMEALMQNIQDAATARGIWVISSYREAPVG